ncbi:MAG: ABC transporter substrate-binding protein [Alphaproteobacteria bacterium]|nr:ABC transporter substrate-binding protein [Alphaproteobacteria bacterium]
MIGRRPLLAASAAIGMGADAARAQAPRPPGRIGYLHPRSADADAATVQILRPTWQRLGYVEGDSFVLRGAEGDLARLPTLARELVAAGAGVIIAVGPSAVRAARQAVPDTSIVAIDLETDPVRTGLAQSFARPGGLVTGLFVDQPSLATKWISLLREAVPGTDRLAIVWDPTTTRDQLELAVEAAAAMRIGTSVFEARSTAEIDGAFARMGSPQGLGVVQLGSPGFAVVAAHFAAAAIRRRLPTISFLRQYAMLGLLLTYGPSQESYFPRAVVLADRILRGERPGTLPIERPDRFELVLNAKTAAAIGVRFPASLQAQSDEVIE